MKMIPNTNISNDYSQSHYLRLPALVLPYLTQRESSLASKDPRFQKR